jgi:hypothetical protein
MKYLALSINGNQIAPPPGVPSGGVGTSLNSIISVGVNLLMIIAILLCIVYIIWGGINWVMSEGDKQKLSQARQKVVFAIIGLIVVFLAYFIVSFVFGLFLGWRSTIGIGGQF